MTKALRGWKEQPDGTLRLSDFGWIAEAGIGSWGECSLGDPLPVTKRGWLLSFGDLVGAACKTEQCAADPRQRFNLNSPPCPVLCMLSWLQRCSRMEASERTRLRISRLELPTPPELRGTAAKSFCEQIVEIVEQRCIWLRRHFVTHTKASLELPIEERLSHESKQICDQFELVSERWQFDPIDAADWMRKIGLELSKCDWLNEQETDGKETDTNAQETRRKAERDATFLRWNEAGMKPAAIRDRWNNENPDDKISEENRTAGRGTVIQALRREKNRKTRGTA